jgi:hypothetical protein
VYSEEKNKEGDRCKVQDYLITQFTNSPIDRLGLVSQFTSQEKYKINSSLVVSI